MALIQVHFSPSKKRYVVRVKGVAVAYTTTCSVTGHPNLTVDKTAYQRFLRTGRGNVNAYVEGNHIILPRDVVFLPAFKDVVSADATILNALKIATTKITDTFIHYKVFTHPVPTMDAPQLPLLAAGVRHVAFFTSDAARQSPPLLLNGGNGGYYIRLDHDYPVWAQPPELDKDGSLLVIPVMLEARQDPHNPATWQWGVAENQGHFFVQCPSDSVVAEIVDRAEHTLSGAGARGAIAATCTITERGEPLVCVPSLLDLRLVSP